MKSRLFQKDGITQEVTNQFDATKFKKLGYKELAESGGPILSQEDSDLIAEIQLVEDPQDLLEYLKETENPEVQEAINKRAEELMKAQGESGGVG